MAYRIIRLIITLITAIGGLALSNFFLKLFWNSGTKEIKIVILALGTVFAALVGFSVVPVLITRISQSTRWLEMRLHKMPTQDLISGAVGVIIGLIIATLLGISFYQLPFVGPYLPIVASLGLGYLGWSVGTKKREEILTFFSTLARLGSKEKTIKSERSSKYKILDTSVIIDGRIADICKTGFLEGTLVVPSFVLEELRHIADSADLLKRNRGRRGLDILNAIRQELGIIVEIWEQDLVDINEGGEVDSKLVKLAQKINGYIITNDFNLNKVAELQEIKVLNINELANAVKPVVLPGEEVLVQVIKDGKESGQGVGYLDDGTMIVVESGKKYIGQSIEVLVTSVLQTAAGRMIFARPKFGERKQMRTLERSEYQCLS